MGKINRKKNTSKTNIAEKVGTNALYWDVLVTLYECPVAFF